MKKSLQALKNLAKTEIPTRFGILGLIVGLICFMYIFLWINNELSYGSSNKNIDRMYQVKAYLDEGGAKMEFQGCPPAVAPALKEEYPTVINSARYSWAIPSAIKYKEKTLNDNIIYADASIFDIFTLKLIEGRFITPNDKRSLVISKTLANTLFGSQDAIGEIVTINAKEEFTVIGIIKDIPLNSGFYTNIISSLDGMKSSFGVDDGFFTTWYNNSFLTIVLINKSKDAALQEDIRMRLIKEVPGRYDKLNLVSFKESYLETRRSNIQLFTAIGIFVLLAAILNFINLNTARSVKQAKEIGIRKIMGSSRMSLIKKIYFDIAIICLFAFALAIIITIIGLPMFNNLLNLHIEFSSILRPTPILFAIGLYIATVLFAGSYSAIFLTKISPLLTMTANFTKVKNRGFIRNCFVFVIFTISISILSSVIFISQQIGLMQNLDLGMKPKQVLAINISDKLINMKENICNELKKEPQVEDASYVNQLPSMIGNNGTCWDWEGREESLQPLVTNMFANDEIFKTYGLTLIEGSLREEGQSGIYINETFANLIGWDSFVGKHLNSCGDDVTILGVFKDFRFNSLREEIKPLVIMAPNYWSSYGYIVVSFAGNNYNNVIDHCENVLTRMDPDLQFSYKFLDEEFNSMVKMEKQLRKMITLFTIFILIVLCLGLLGVIIFTTEQSNREIGIRKCMGASVKSLILKFIKPYIFTGLIAAVAAIPITIYIVDSWLENYAYKISLSPIVFAISILGTLILALLTVIYQSWCAANQNPISTLKYE